MPIEPSIRFWAKVDKIGPIPEHVPHLGECWVWTAHIDSKGRYGTFRIGASIASMAAHRASWILNVGPIPVGLRVCHKCDNPKCVRPSHLFVGTDRDNTLDAQNKARRLGPFLHKSVCKRGHAQTQASVYVSPDGSRACNICKKESRDKWRLRNGWDGTRRSLTDAAKERWQRPEYRRRMEEHLRKMVKERCANRPYPSCIPGEGCR
jgi:hypothetical protein